MDLRLAHIGGCVFFIEGRVLRKTIKTSSKRGAIEFATQFYDTVTVNYQQGILIGSHYDSEKVTAAILKEEKGKLDRGEITSVLRCCRADGKKIGTCDTIAHKLLH